MKIDSPSIEDLSKMQDKLIQVEKQERLATGAVTTEILSKLNLLPANLPQRCQELLQKCATLQLATGVKELDPTAIAFKQSEETSNMMKEEYELLELRQKNAELERQIDRNRKFIEGLKKELQNSKESLAVQNPSPDTIQEHIKHMSQKLKSYEEFNEKAKTKYASLHVPYAILPKSIEELAGTLATLKQEEDNLKQRADDITLARQARDTLNMLKRGTV